MTETREMPEDVLMLVSAQNAGKDEIDEFLRCSGDAPGKRCIRRILKRIKHPDLYRDGKLTARSKLAAWLMLALLAAFFAILGYCSARMLDNATSVQGGAVEYFRSIGDRQAEDHKVTTIKEFMLPEIDGALSAKELVRSSLIYNVEFSTDDGNIYYLQKVREKPDKDDSDTEPDRSADTADPDAFYVLVGEYRGQITKDTSTGNVLFEISWSDEQHTYSISGNKTMEQAVRHAKSIYRSEQDKAIKK